MQKWIRTFTAIALAASLIMTGALAEQADWTVADFLFGGDTKAASELIQAVNASGTDGQVTLSVNSAVTDGDTLALDWSIENSKPEEPVLALVESFTLNGVPVAVDQTDEFDCQWLPGCFSEDGTMQDGENLMLPASLQSAQTLRVEMTVGVYRSTLPIYNMETYDEQEARQKIAQGYLVVPEGEGYVDIDPDEGANIVVGSSRKALEKNFTRTEVDIAFDVDTAPGRALARQLETQPTYTAEGFTFSYSKAQVSPLGLHLEVQAKADNASDTPWPCFDQYILTDGEGTPLDVAWPDGEGTSQPAKGGGIEYDINAYYYGLLEEDLPDTISLSYFEDGITATLIFPVKVR